MYLKSLAYWKIILIVFVSHRKHVYMVKLNLAQSSCFLNGTLVFPMNSMLSQTLKPVVNHRDFLVLFLLVFYCCSLKSYIIQLELW